MFNLVFFILIPLRTGQGLDFPSDYFVTPLINGQSFCQQDAPMIRSKFALSKTIISQFIEKDKTANLKIELRYFNMTSKKSETIAEANIDLARAEKSGQFFHRILNKRGNTIGEVTLVPK